MKRKSVLTLELKPGDLVWSPRTDQLMLILSTMPREENINITWMPLKDQKPVMSVDISGRTEFFKLEK